MEQEEERQYKLQEQLKYNPGETYSKFGIKTQHEKQQTKDGDSTDQG